MIQSSATLFLISKALVTNVIVYYFLKMYIFIVCKISNKCVCLKIFVLYYIKQKSEVQTLDVICNSSYANLIDDNNLTTVTSIWPPKVLPHQSESLSPRQVVHLLTFHLYRYLLLHYYLGISIAYYLY